MKPLKEGQRVRVKSLNIKGTVSFVDQPNYFLDYMHPIQVELDRPYDEHKQTMFRTNIKDIVRLKKKNKPEEIFFDFSED